jgi:hypothetical protein
MNRILFPWFPSELTSEFLRFYNHESAKVARVSLILGGIVYVGFYIWDRVIDIEHLLETLIIRLGIALMILAILLGPRNVFERHLQKFVSVAIVTAGLAHVAILSIVKDGFVLGMPGVILVLMYNFGIFSTSVPTFGDRWYHCDGST